MNAKRWGILVALAFGLSFGLAFAQEVTITVRGKASPPTEDWRCNAFLEVVDDLNAELAAEGDTRQVTVNPVCDNTDWGEYKQEFVLASDAGEAPDIYVAGHEDIGSLSAAGYILPLDDMIRSDGGDYAYEEFADVIDGLWTSASYNGTVWSVPQDAEARPLFYSKPLLRELGWSDEEIASLPERIRSGEFTWADLMATAREAIDAGVVEEGNGFWHRPANGPDFLYYYYGFGGQLEGEDGGIVFDTEAARQVYELFSELTESGIMREDMLGGLEWSEWHTAVSSAEEVLFWAGGTWNWGDWAVNYRADQGGQDYLFENIGYALIPPFTEGGDAITLTHPLVYTISSATEHPDLALRLIAKVTTPEINTLHAVDSAHLGIVESQADYAAYTEDAFLSDVLYMLENTTFISNSEFYSAWSNAYFEGIQAVQVGDLTPDEAVEFVVQRLQNELRDNITIQ